MTTAEADVLFYSRPVYTSISFVCAAISPCCEAALISVGWYFEVVVIGFVTQLLLCLVCWQAKPPVWCYLS